MVSREVGVRLDIIAEDFWDTKLRTFFDIRASVYPFGSKLTYFINLKPLQTEGEREVKAL
jgi:hypothetical protein